MRACVGRGLGARVRAGLALVTCLTGCAKGGDAAPPPSTELASPVDVTPAVALPEPASVPKRRFTSPVDHPVARNTHAVVLQRMLGTALEPSPLVHFTPIEDPSGEALTSFHEALRALADGERERVRVGVYGSSSVAVDRYTAYLRGYLQHRFGDGGVGFVSVVPLWRWHRHDAVQVASDKRWTIEHAQRTVGKLDGYYGLLGASAHTTARRASTRVLARPGSHTDASGCQDVELYFLRQPGGGRFDVDVAGHRVATIDSDAPAFEPGYASIPVHGTAVPLEVRTRGDGEVRLLGATFERAAAGVVVDTLGIGGTRAANMVAWNEALWRDNVARRPYDLYVLAYGANEAVDEDEPIELYRESLTRVLTRFALTLPEASCLLVGPVDFPVRDPDPGNGAAAEDGWIGRPRIDAIITAQRELAAAFGCGFWDTRAFMGGPGTMHAWTQAKLAKDDHLHLTTRGYLHLGRVLTDALMAAFDGPALEGPRLADGLLDTPTLAGGGRP